MKSEEFTFKDSGITVKIRKVSPLLSRKLSESFPAPLPPLQEVDYGDGAKRKERNPSDPEYLDELQKYNAMFERKIQKLIIERGVDIVIGEQEKTEIEEVKKYMKEEMDVDLSGESDKLVYISYIACSSPEDLNSMINHIVSQSQPTEEEVNKAIDSFQSDDKRE